MATISDQQRAELLVHDEAGTRVPIIINSVVVTGDTGAIGFSPLYGDGQLDIIGQAAGVATVTVTIGQSTGSVEVTVTEAEPGTLVVTLGAPRPK